MLSFDLAIFRVFDPGTGSQPREAETVVNAFSLKLCTAKLPFLHLERR
jgi:hypothetical protein